jgi:hypothetical protein
MKTEKQINDFLSGKDEVILTDELIEKLVKEKKWGDVKTLKEMANKGAKWNIRRNSIIFSTNF